MFYPAWLQKTVFLLLACAAALGAAEPAGSADVLAAQYYFENLSVEDGLLHSLVWDVHQDEYGFMWFATQGGLCRYDGYQFDHFLNDPTDSISLADNDSHLLYEDDDGDLWIAGRSLNRFSRQTESFQRYVLPTDKPFDYINAMHKHGDYIWLATHGAGLFYVKLPDTDAERPQSPKALDIIQHFTLLPDSVASDSRSNVLAILCDDSNNLWIGSGWGLSLFKPATAGTRPDQAIPRVKVDLPPQLAPVEHELIRAIYPDSDGILWIGTTGRLYKYDPALTSPAPVYDILPRDDSPDWRRLVNTIQDDDNGRLWIGTLSYLVQFDKRTNTSRVIRTNNNEPSKVLNGQMTAIFLDQKNVLWLASNGYGIYKYRRSSEAVSTFQIEDPHEKFVGVRGITQDKSGDVWFSSRSRSLVYRINRTTNTFQDYRFPVPDYVYNSLLTDKNGHVWFSSGLDVIQFDPQTTQVLWQLDTSEFDEIDDNGYTLALEDESHLWLVDERLESIKRLNIDSKEIESFAPQPLMQGDVKCVYIGTQQRLWIGCERGLVLFDARTQSLKTDFPMNNMCTDHI